MKKSILFCAFLTVLSIGNAQTNGNYFISSSLWEGNKWTQNVSQGAWFPVVDTVARFGLDSISWGQVRTKAEIPVNQKVTISAYVYLNSNNGSSNIARIGFGDGWSLYQGQSFGLKFYNGKIIVHKMTPTEANVDTLGTYTPGELVTFSLLRNTGGTITLSAKNVTKTYTNPATMSAYKCIIAVSDANPNMFLVRSVDTAAVVAPPTIASFYPSSGPIGTTVTITGTNFNTTAANNVVYFGATKAPINTASSTQLTVTVPVGAIYAPITVIDTVSGLSGSSNKYYDVMFPSSATITSSTFGGEFLFTTASEPQGIGVGDLDGDGKPDIVLATTAGSSLYIYRNISTVGSLTSSSFAAPIVKAVISRAGGVALADLNGDGKLDIVVSSDYSGSYYISVYQNISSIGNIAFASPIDIATGTNSGYPVVADVDGDGKPDILGTNYGSSRIFIIQNVGEKGAITSASLAAQVNFSVGSGVSFPCVGDFDGDGKLDVAVNDYVGGVIKVFRNIGTVGLINTNTLASPVSFATTSQTNLLRAVDIDGDGKLDLVVNDQPNGVLLAFKNNSTNGTISFGSYVSYSSGTSTGHPIIADINGDGKPDILSSLTSGTTGKIFRNTATSGTIDANSFALPATFTYTNAPSVNVLADLDGDGKPDLVTSHYFSAKMSIQRNLTLPQTPSGLSAGARNGQVALSWHKIAENRFLKYRIYMGTDSVTMALKDSTTASILDTTKTITGLANGTKYYFRVSALDSARLESGQSYAVGISPNASVVPAGLVAWYPLNGSAADSSGNGHNAALSGGSTTLDRFNHASKALSFNGTSDYGYTGADNSLDSYSRGTVSFWIKTHSPDSTSEVLSYSTDATLGSLFIFGTYQSKAWAQFKQDSYGHNPLWSGSTIMQSGRWYHITFVADGSSMMKIFVNGVAENVVFDNNTTPATGSEWFASIYGVSSYNHFISIGALRRAGAPEGFFNGQIDDMRIYNRALTSSEIDSLYQEGGWTLPTWQYQLKATAGSNADNENYFGAGKAATDGFDASLDIPKSPTPPSNYVQLYFPHPEYSQPTGDNFAQDMRSEHAIGDTTMRWRFEVKTNFDTTVTIEAVPDGKLPPKIKTLLRDLTGGTRTFLKSGSMTYSFRSGAGINVRRFEILIGDSLAPSVLVLKPNGGEIIRSGKNYSLSYYASDKSGIDTTQVYYSINSGTTYTKAATLSGNTSPYSWNAPSVYLNYQGSMKIAATDSMGNTAIDASDHVFTIVGDSLTQPFTAGWSLVGLPLKPVDSTVAEVFGDDISQPFYMYDYSPSGGYSRSSILSTGKGYWLGLLANYTIDVAGAPYTDSLSMPLAKGWNIVSNPLAVPIPKDSLRFRQSGITKKYADAMSAGWIATGLQTYKANSYVNQDTLQLWNGYWLSVLQDNVSIVAVPPVIGAVPAQDALEKKLVPSPLDWQVSIVASYASTSDQTLRFGVKPDATTGFDPKYDEPKAPAPPAGKYVESYFNYPSWAPLLGSKFNGDIRNPNSLSGWTFSVAPSDTGVVTLTWTVPSTVPDSIQLSLADGTFKINMRKQSSYTFAARLPGTLTVNVTITSVKDNSQLPTEYALEQNYPNPFNPSTTIQYSLPYRSSVRLEVFSVLGQRVAALYGGEQAAGYQRVQWNAGVSTGMYIYRLEAISIENPNNRFVQVKKMLLLK
jgi:hypothetical protein